MESKLKRLIGTRAGFQLQEASSPILGVNDVIVETHSSFFSPGTELAIWKSETASALQKAIKFKDQIAGLVQKGDFKILIQKIKKQQALVTVGGYSSFGRVLAVGDKVSRLSAGQFVVALGSSANHAELSVVPQGLCFPADYNLDNSCAAVAAISLNAVELSSMKSFSKVCVIGAGVIGQFLIQFLTMLGHKVFVVDTDESKSETSLRNGAAHFAGHLSKSHFGPSIFQNIFVTAPALKESDWKFIANVAAIGAEVSMVGAADLNVPRKLFYPKRLKFSCPHSYGIGRGEYMYEISGDRNDVKYPGGDRIDTIVEKVLELIGDGRLNINFVDRVGLTELGEGDISDIIQNRTIGLNFVWKPESSVQPVEVLLPEKRTEDLSQSTEDGFDFGEIDVLGNSSYFQLSHLPSLKKLGIAVNNLKTRSPVSNPQETDHLSKSLLISTPHAEHYSNIFQNSDAYQYIFVDKPLVAFSNEYRDLEESVLDDKLNIMALMSRRYSAYTQLLKKFINENSGPLRFGAKFSVPKKGEMDRIFFEGGRLIGEMCHHVDLAIYLLGSVNRFEVIDLDPAVESGKKENQIIFLWHDGGHVSELHYTNFSDCQFEKEFVSVSSNLTSIEVYDFRDIKVKNYMGFDQNITQEGDKGNKAMWELIQGHSAQGELKKLMRHSFQIDREVNRILMGAAG